MNCSEWSFQTFLYYRVKNLSFSRCLNYQLNSPTPCPFFRGKPRFRRSNLAFFVGLFLSGTQSVHVTIAHQKKRRGFHEPQRSARLAQFASTRFFPFDYSLFANLLSAIGCRLAHAQSGHR